MRALIQFLHAVVKYEVEEPRDSLAEHKDWNNGQVTNINTVFVS